MKRNLAKILCIALILLLAAAVFVGCNNDKKDNSTNFEISAVDGDGSAVSGVSLIVKKDGTQIAAGDTDGSGKFSFKAEAGVYDVEVSSVPSGYELPSGGFKIGESGNSLVITLSSEGELPPPTVIPDGSYGVRTRSVGGAYISGVRVTVSLDGQQVAEGVTDVYGVFVFEGAPDEYDVAVSDIPAGYTASANNVYKTSVSSNELILFFESALVSEIDDSKFYQEGDIFFDFEISDAVYGRSYRLSEILQTKKMVLLNFWNTNCVPCVSEMPGLNIAYQEYRDKAEVLAISTMFGAWNSVADVRNFAASQDPEFEYPLFADGTGPSDVTFNRHLAISSIPVTVVIDRYGMVALMHVGSMGTTQFRNLFAKYTADDYVQDVIGGGGSEGDDGPIQREEPTKTQPDSALIEAAINGSGFDGEWYPESGTEDAKYSWPWELVSITDGGRQIEVLQPGNHDVDYSFATIKTSVEISQDAIDNGGNVALAFDLKYSTENNCDYLYVIVNNKLIYSYTGTEGWASWHACYPFVADEAGRYELTLLYNKDDMNGGGFDTVYIKNVRLIPAAAIGGSLDMPRPAARGWNADAKTFSDYVHVEKDGDGFYHYLTADGPYVLADIFGTTEFQDKRGFEMNVSEAAVNELFKYDNGVDRTSAITPYCAAANNSELTGLTVVDEDLKNMLSEFAKSRYKECVDESWLELCIWFEHFGDDPSDKGVSTPDRNPVRGLMKQTAFEMKPVYQGQFPDLLAIPDQFKNQVVIDRIIMPRGLIYKIVPDKSGAYRFRSQSSYLSDTTAWLRDETQSVESCLVEVGEEREDADYEYNFVLTWYLEADKSYYLSVSLADVGGTGEFTFTTEYLGPEFYTWEHVAGSVVSFVEAEHGEIGDMINLLNAYPVLNEEDGYYYDAVRGKDGKPILDAQGNMQPDLDDPIYVDFFSTSHFMDNTISSIIDMGETNGQGGIMARLQYDILPAVFGANKIPTTVSLYTKLTQFTATGDALTPEQWEQLRNAIANPNYGYGETVTIGDDLMPALIECDTVLDLINFLKKYFLAAFDFSTWRNATITVTSFEEIDGELYNHYAEVPMTEYLGVAADDLKNYTSRIKEIRAAAEAKLNSSDYPDRGGFDKGCVRVDKELKLILELFAQRYGWVGLKTDWTRLCMHYERYGA